MKPVKTPLGLPISITGNKRPLQESDVLLTAVSDPDFDAATEPECP